VDAEMTIDFPEPSPIIGKPTARASHQPSKPGGNQGSSKGKSKHQSTDVSLLGTNNKANSSKKCPPSKN
jgi:hypothetical protein